MDSPLRVLHVVVNMNRGGAETMLMNLYRKMDRSKVQFDFLTNRFGEFDAEIQWLGGCVHRIPPLAEAGHLSYIRSLNKFFAEHQGYQIVHAHMDRLSGIVLEAARLASIPVRIAHSHCTKSEGNLPIRLYKYWASRYIAEAATERAACSRAAAKWLFGTRAGDTLVVPNGIDEETFRFESNRRVQAREGLGIGSSTLILGHVGRLTPQKNHLQLLHIYAKFAERHPDSLLLLVGEGPLREKIEKLAIQLGISERVRLLGMRSDVPDLLQAFDVLVFPSLFEGLPLTLVEAQAAGLPCVISDTISNEVDMGLGLVSYASNKDAEQYALTIARRIEAAKAEQRASDLAAIRKRGYAIRKTAATLQGWYLLQSEVRNESFNRVYTNL